MKIYLFFIQRDIFPQNIRYITQEGESIPVDDTEYSLYAYTTSKKLRDKFLQERINKFIFFTRNITKEEYERFKKERSYFELRYIEYKNYNYSIKILSTPYEYRHTKYSWTDIFEDNKTLARLPCDLIEAINEPYQDALVKLGLNHLIMAYNEELSGIIIANSIHFNDDSVFIIDDESFEKSSGIVISVSLQLKPKEYNFYIHEFKALYK